MIDTNLENYLLDMQEEINLFKNGNEYKIRHRYKSEGNKIVNTITVDGKTYAYGNFVILPENEVEKKRLIKRYAKLSIYKALSAYSGESNSWGALTGVRPTKLAYSSLTESGEFSDFFTSVMKVSEKKTSLTEKVIESQKGIYVKDDKNCDFFVFIPFCPSRCKYCSFISQDTASAGKLVDEYVSALVKEINASKDLIKNLRSIYVGGGTPVSLSDENLEKVLSAIDQVNSGVEYTVEAGRPDRITESNLKILKAHNVNRICINPQTFNDKTLKKIGRFHTSDDIIRSYELAKNDFSLNMDLIAGLEDESFEDFKYSIDKSISLSPDNITVHTLSLKRGAYLVEDNSRITDGETVEKMVDYAEDSLEKAGYKPYYLYRQKYMTGNLENVGYTKTGKACIYNVDTMEEISNCVACGANGISKKINFNEERIERYGTPKDVKTYIEKVDKIIEEKKSIFG